MRPSTLDRFSSKLSRDGDCLLWTGAVHHSGYGAFAVSGKRVVRAHRYAYEQAYGPPPPGAVVRHTCDRPLCCEPTHLVAGTQQDNVADRQERGRQARGERVGTVKLDAERVRAIRTALASGTAVAVLAQQYSVGLHTIRSIRSGRTWRHA